MEQSAPYLKKKAFTKTIICMSSTHWHFLWQRPQQLMSRLSREYNVLFVDPPSLVAATTIERQELRKQITSRIYSISPSLKVLFPFQVDSKATAQGFEQQMVLNINLMQEQIGKALAYLRWHAAKLLWVYNPQAVSNVGTLGEEGVIYDCVDSFASFSWSDPRTASWETELMQKANVVFASASKLYEQCCQKAKEVYLVPNAADYDHFSSGVRFSSAEPPDLKRIKRPRLGFVGAVYEWLDFSLLESVARMNPQWNLVMIGPRQPELKVPEQYPNIHWLGTRDYKTLPWYLHHLDVMLIPFLRNQTTENANPIKLWEYLAAGKPVVTTDLPEIPAISGVTWVSKDAHQFAQNCANALERIQDPNCQKELASRARIIAKNNSWDGRCKEMASVLRERFG